MFDDLDSLEDEISSFFDLFGIGYLPRTGNEFPKKRSEHQRPAYPGLTFMNYFVFSLGIINMFASMKYFYDGNWKLALITICYGLANFVFSTLK